MQLSCHQMDEEALVPDTSYGIVTLLCPWHIVSAELTRHTPSLPCTGVGKPGARRLLANYWRLCELCRCWITQDGALLDMCLTRALPSVET
jgi:hypothetical protein